jgi:hypothetical protein
MLERDGLKVLDEALAVLEQGFAAMPEAAVPLIKLAPLSQS